MFAIRFSAKVLAIEEKFRQDYVSGTGADTIYNSVSLGWFVLYEGSYEALFAGTEKPDLAVGDTVTIRIRKDNGNS